MGLIMYGHPERIPECADIYYDTIVWHDVEKEPGKYDWNAKPLPALFRAAKKNDRQVALRLVTSWQNYENPIPDYLVERGVGLFPYGKNKTNYRCFYEPEWWHPEYVKAYLKLIRAYGEEFDGDPRVAWIDMRYYGFWNEGHRHGATVAWPADVDKRELLKKFIDVHFEAFRKTPLVIQMASDKDTPYPHGTAIDHGLEKSAWMRRDGFGPYISPEEEAVMKGNWKGSLVIAENGGSLRDYLALKVRKYWVPDSKPITIDQLFDQMFDFHVNYFPLGWGIQDYRALERERADLLKDASLKTGYRLAVKEARWPEEVSPGTLMTVKTTWQNTGVGRLPLRYVPAVYLVDRGATVRAASFNLDADPTQWFEGAEYEVPFGLKAPAEPGEYSVRVAIVDEEKMPAIDLAIEGGDGRKRFELGTINIAAE